MSGQCRRANRRPWHCLVGAVASRAAAQDHAAGGIEDDDLADVPAEVWLAQLRTSGMGSAYAFGGIGKILGPLALALIVGSGNFVKPDVPVPEIPMAFLYLGSWFLMAGAVYYFLGFETGGRSIEEIDRDLGSGL